MSSDFVGECGGIIKVACLVFIRGVRGAIKIMYSDLRQGQEGRYNDDS